MPPFAVVKHLDLVENIGPGPFITVLIPPPRRHRHRYHMETLARDTRKFESRYLDRLIGAYPAERDRYLARSPIHAVDRLSCPVIFFQGLDDAVVPPSQAERMVEALRSRGLPVAYLAFEGEQHGFRKAETIERTLQAELCFYARVFGFTPADDLPELAIDNL
jgi:dipeptidyl aminopeptidase/acylaminoacyl peptidase